MFLLLFLLATAIPNGFLPAFLPGVEAVQLPGVDTEHGSAYDESPAEYGEDIVDERKIIANLSIMVPFWRYYDILFHVNNELFDLNSWEHREREMLIYKIRLN